MEFNILPKEDIDEIKKIIEFCDEMKFSDFNICIDFEAGSVSQYINFINNKLLDFNDGYLISKSYQNRWKVKIIYMLLEIIIQTI